MVSVCDMCFFMQNNSPHSIVELAIKGINCAIIKINLSNPVDLVHYLKLFMEGNLNLLTS